MADISLIGRPSILVPLGIATDDHQTANARGLAEAGGAVVMAEGAFTVEAVAAQVEAILNDPNEATSMAQAALKEGRPNATQALADLTLELADSQHKTQK